MQVYKTSSELVGRGGLGVAVLLAPQAVPCALLELYGGKQSKKRPLEQGNYCRQDCFWFHLEAHTMIANGVDILSFLATGTLHSFSQHLHHPANLLLNEESVVRGFCVLNPLVAHVV